MAGDLYIESLSYDDLANIKKCGGELQEKVFHADKDAQINFTILDKQLKEVVQKRTGLPPHCYITFDKNKTDKLKIIQLSSILQRTSCPLGIVKEKKSLNNWSLSSDVQKAICLWETIQNGPITLEFYKVGLWGVKSHFKDFEMIDE